MPDHDDPALDDRDRLLMALLRQDARRPVAEIARRLNLSRTAVRHRLERLETRGTITGYTITGPTSAPGVQALMSIVLHDASCAQLRAAIRHHAEVRRIWSVTGDTDTVVLLAAATLDDVRRIADFIGALPHVARATTQVVLDTMLER